MNTPSASVTIRPQMPREEPIFGVRTPGDTDDLSKIPSLEQALNPLHYIPFVGQVYESMSGNEGNAALKLIGGAILGGPLGFIAGLANVIFEQQTGKGVIGAVASAIMGEDEPQTQLASAKATQSYTQTASLSEGVTPAGNTEILPPQSAQLAQGTNEQAQLQLASAIAEGGAMDPEEAQILALFGGQQASAHKSYQKAQMLPYLKDVSTSMVM